MSTGVCRPAITRFNQKAVVIYSVVLLLAWITAFLRGMFPFFENSILVDMALMCAAGLALAAVPIAMLCSLGHDNPHAVRKPFTWRLLAVTLLALGGTVLLVMGLPVMLGTRVGGKLEIGMKPVRDLQDSPAVARIASAGEYAQLPKEAWPVSLNEWKTHVWSVEIIPHGSGTPDIRVNIGHRGARIDGVSILRNPPEDTGYDVYTQWADGVWLSRRLGGD